MSLKYLMILAMLVISLTYVSGQQQLFGDFIKGENITLQQLCPNCSSVNIAVVNYPDGSIVISNVSMINEGNYWTYELEGSLINQSGTYVVLGDAQQSTKTAVWGYTFEVKDNNPLSLGFSKSINNIIILVGFFITLLTLVIFKRFETIGLIMFIISIYLTREQYLNQLWSVIALVGSASVLAFGIAYWITKGKK